MKTCKVKGFIDNYGEAKSIGTIGHGPDQGSPAGMAAFIQFPEMYRRAGTLFFLADGASFWAKVKLLFI